MKTKPDRIRSLPGSFAKINGFTLVELLVVITIIAVLASVIMVMTQKIKNRAYQATALSSLRQVGVFNVGYSTENSGDINTMRYVGDPKEGGGGKWVSNSFWGRSQSFLFSDSPPANQNNLKTALNQRLDQLFSTPDANKMTNTLLNKSRIYHDGSGLPVPLAFNQNLAKWGNFSKVSSFSDPSQVLYATYGFGMFNEADGREYAPMPKVGEAVASNIYYLEDRKALGIFLDGHVETLTAPIDARKFE